MKKISMTYILIAALLGLTGCDAINNMASGKSPFEKKKIEAPAEKAFEYITSPQLAKVIIKPERKPLKINRDPFKPLITKEMFANHAELEQKVSPLSVIQDTLDDVVLIGVIRYNNEFRAYLKTNTKTGIFKLQDKIRNYSIERIDSNEIVFRYGNNEIVKKREKK